MEARAGISRPARRGHWRLAMVLSIAVLAGIGVGAGIHALLQHRSPTAAIVSSRHGLDGMATWAASARPAPAINALADQTGHRFSLSSLHGHAVALVFFDSHCTQQCPLEGRQLAAAERALPAAARPVLVAVSVNTADTRGTVRAAIRKWGLGAIAPWHWLMGTRPTLSRVWHAYHIWVGPEVNGDVMHTEAIYLIDRRGYERSAYLFPFAPQRVAHDLRALA